jgi:hypothetical protein
LRDMVNRTQAENLLTPPCPNTGLVGKRFS